MCAPAGMPPFRMRQCQAMHESRELNVRLRPGNQVEVIGHDAVGEDAHARLLLCFIEHAQESCIIKPIVEELESARGAVQDVTDEAGDNRALTAGHILN